MVYRIEARQFQKISQQARRAASKGGMEICGLLISNGYFLSLLELNNKTKRGGGFSFYYREVRKAKQACHVLQYDIAGTFHSHPVYLAQPSGSDVVYAVDDSLLLIFDVMGKQAKLWHVKNGLCSKRRFTLVK